MTQLSWLKARKSTTRTPRPTFAPPGGHSCPVGGDAPTTSAWAWWLGRGRRRGTPRGGRRRRRPDPRNGRPRRHRSALRRPPPVRQLDHRVGDRAPRARLTRDEQALVEMLLAGESLSAAARKLNLARRTADRRLASVRAKLRVETTAEALIAITRHPACQAVYLLGDTQEVGGPAQFEFSGNVELKELPPGPVDLAGNRGARGSARSCAQGRRLREASPQGMRAPGPRHDGGRGPETFEVSPRATARRLLPRPSRSCSPPARLTRRRAWSTDRASSRGVEEVEPVCLDRDRDAVVNRAAEAAPKAG